MPEQNSGDLLGEGIRSYRTVLYAIVEFRRQMLQVIWQVRDKRLDELCAALDMKLPGGQEWAQHLDPANVNESVDGSYATVGWRYPVNWQRNWMVLLYWRVDETTEAGHAYVTLWLRSPREAIKALRSKQLPDWNQNKGETAVSVPLAAPNAEALRTAFEAAVDKAIALWNVAGGARQFLPIEQAPTDAPLSN